HSHPKRHRLRLLSRPDRPNAADLAGKQLAHGMVSRVPPRSEAAFTPVRPGLQHELEAFGLTRRPTRTRGATCYGKSRAQFDQLLDLPPLRTIMALDLDAVRQRLI